MLYKKHDFLPGLSASQLYEKPAQSRVPMQRKAQSDAVPESSFKNLASANLNMALRLSSGLSKLKRGPFAQTKMDVELLVEVEEVDAVGVFEAVVADVDVEVAEEDVVAVLVIVLADVLVPVEVLVLVPVEGLVLVELVVTVLVCVLVCVLVELDVSVLVELDVDVSVLIALDVVAVVVVVVVVIVGVMAVVVVVVVVAEIDVEVVVVVTIVVVVVVGSRSMRNVFECAMPPFGAPPTTYTAYMQVCATCI